MGFPSQLNGGYSEARQAALLARTYLTARASGAVEHVAWYDFRNDGANRFDHEQNFGAIRSDFRLKPGYRALATLAAALDQKRVAERMDVGDGAYAFRFTAGRPDLPHHSGTGEDAIAVCAPDAARLLTFESDAEPTVVNGVGERIEPHRIGNRFTLTLDAEFPVYITGRAGFLFRPAEPPITWRLDEAGVQAGRSVRLEIDPASEVARWEWPFAGAPPTRGPDGRYLLSIPEDAPPGQHLIQAFVRHGAMLRIPISIRVQNALLRV
jgi:hypothetical protein